jgi:hypothetical protein
MIKNFDSFINEGLIMTHDINTSNNIISKYLSTYKIKYKIEIDNELSNIYIIFNNLFLNKNISDYEAFFNKLNKIIKNLGYFISSYIINKSEAVLFNEDKSFIDIINDSPYILLLTIEAKFTTPTHILYHVTLKSKLNKIFKNGLIPKTIDKKSWHPERVYLCKDIKTAEHIIYNFINYDKTLNIKDFVILKINNIGNIKIFPDPNDTPGGYYTYDNISPKNISIFKEL